jgi:PQQ-like domain
MRIHLCVVGIVVASCTGGAEVVRDGGVAPDGGGADASVTDASVADVSAAGDGPTDATVDDGRIFDSSSLDAAPTGPCANSGGSPWPMFGRCASRQGLTNVVGAQTSHISWLVAPSIPFQSQFSSSVIAADGTIYFQNRNNGLYAISSTGTFNWSVGSQASSPPALGADGTIYFFDGSALQAVNPDSTSKWSLALPSWPIEIGAPAVGSDGTVYAAACPTSESEGHLTAITPAGAIVWDVAIGPRVDAGASAGPCMGATVLALASDGTILVNADSRPDGGANVTGQIGAFHADGSPSWTFDTPCPALGPVVAPDGTIRFLCGDSGATGNALYALNADGTQKWALTLSTPADGLSVGADGTSYFVNASLFSVDPSGSPAWTFTSTSTTIADVVPAIGGDGTIYVGAGNGLLAVNPDGTLKWQASVVTSYGFLGQPSIGADGTVYAADLTIYAFGP